MNIGEPSWLIALLLLPLLGAWLWRAERARAVALRAILSPEAAEALGAGAAVTARRRRQAWAAGIGVGLCLLAMAGPRLGFTWQQQRMEGVTLAAVLDVSRSMQAQDAQPSRMEVARRELLDLSGMLRGDAIGLVIFARGAWLRLPPTVDYDTFRWALQDSEPGVIRAQGTSLAGALQIAVEALSRAEGTGKAIVLISDGEAHDPEAEIQAAAAAAREAGVRIYAVGVGTEAGAPIPLTEGGFKEDAEGNLVVSRADPEKLRALAEATGGAYVASVASEEDMRVIYEQEIRGKLQAASRGVRTEKIWQERFQWPLAAALLLMVYGSAQGIGRGRAKVGAGAGASASATLLLIGLVAAPVARAGAEEDGLAAWKAGRYAEAIEPLGQARVEDPRDPEVGRALAESLYRAGRYREAEAIYRSLAAQAQTAEERAAWSHNAGNAAYRAGRLEDALQHYGEAADQLPSLQAAKDNADLVREEIRRREQKQQEQQEQQEQQQQQGQEQQQQQQQGQQGQGQQQEQQGGEQQQGQQGQEQQDPQGQQQGQQGQQEAQGQPQGQQGQEQQGQEQQGQAQGQAQGQGQEQPEMNQQGTPAAQAEPTSPGGMTREEAARLVESVPDGKPQGVVGGASDGRDW